MYCIKCGVRLADTEPQCPLCGTVVCHPDYPIRKEESLYPSDKMPHRGSGTKALSGAVIIVFMIPLLLCFFADLLSGGVLTWFGYVAGALGVVYVAFALPLWFRKPNPVIFVPCSFAAVVLYLLYINLATGGRWFLSFAFPVAGGLGLIISGVVTLLRYLHRGRLYIMGGTFIAIGGFILLIEFLMDITFELAFIGWSIYPAVVLIMFGGLLLYLAINRDAREAMGRKLFF